MPAEDPNQAEELLKRYAKARREQGGDFPLHPATRRLLQGEVARTYPPGTREPRRGFWVWLGGWPKLALGATAIAAVTFLAIWMGNPGRENELRLGDNLAQTPQPSAEKPAEVEQLALLQLKRDSQRPLEEKQIKEAFEKKLSDREQQTRVEPLYTSAGLGALKDGATTAPTPPPPAAQGPESTAFQVVANEPRPDGDLRAMAPAAPAVPAPVKTEASPRASAASTDTRAGVSLTVVAQGGQAALPLDALRPQSESGAATGAEVIAAKGNAAATNTSTLNYLADTPMLGAALELTKPAESDQARTDRYYDFGTVPSRGGTVFFRQNRPGESTVHRQTMRRSEELKTTETDEAGAPGILDRFTFEQRGSMVRMLESDGSVYEGTIITVANAEDDFAGLPIQEEVRDRSRARRTNERQSAAPSSRFYSFQAIGTNVTLGKPVLVQARLREDTAASPPAGPELETRRKEAIVSGRSQAPAPTQPASPSGAAGEGLARQSGLGTNRFRSIEGTLRVGGTNEQPFKAVTIPR